MRNMDCGNNKYDEDGNLKTVEVEFIQMYNPLMILGQSETINLINKETVPDERNQKHDVKLVYSCDKTYSIFAQPNVTTYSQSEYETLMVNPSTCEPYREDDDYYNKKSAINSVEGRDMARETKWSTVEFVLLSLMVSGSFLAGYNPITFYTGIVYIAFTPVRAAFIFYTYTGF